MSVGQRGGFGLQHTDFDRRCQRFAAVWDGAAKGIIRPIRSGLRRNPGVWLVVARPMTGGVDVRLQIAREDQWVQGGASVFAWTSQVSFDMKRRSPSAILAAPCALLYRGEESLMISMILADFLNSFADGVDGALWRPVSDHS